MAPQPVCRYTNEDLTIICRIRGKAQRDGRLLGFWKHRSYSHSFVDQTTPSNLKIFAGYSQFTPLFSMIPCCIVDIFAMKSESAHLKPKFFGSKILGGGILKMWIGSVFLCAYQLGHNDISHITISAISPINPTVSMTCSSINKLH